MADNTLGAAFDRLLQTAAARRNGDPDTSYTARLLSEGPERCAKKFGEEAVEAVIAGVAGDKAALAEETADVLYHLSVFLTACDVAPGDIAAVLAAREGVSGLDEKAARKK
ncbi:MAG: phosphoribosyl-ATP diphosphatase [Pseudomonadota bacterium]